MSWTPCSQPIVADVIRWKEPIWAPPSRKRGKPDRIGEQLNPPRRQTCVVSIPGPSAGPSDRKDRPRHSAPAAAKNAGCCTPRSSPLPHNSAYHFDIHRIFPQTVPSVLPPSVADFSSSGYPSFGGSPDTLIGHMTRELIGHITRSRHTYLTRINYGDII